MKFTDASKVLSTITACDTAEYERGQNRAKIQNLFNGAPPVSEADAKKLGLKINVNLGEAPVLAQHGRRQYSNAFLSRGRYFKVSIPDAPVEKQAEWGMFITNKINRYLKKSREYLEMHRSQWAAVLLHGIAPKLWHDKHTPIPKFIAIEDFRVPTDTEISMCNLQWFAVRKRYSEGELMKKLYGKTPDPGWQKDAVIPLLDRIHEKSSSSVDYTWQSAPEKMAELIKQNAGYYSSDAVPTIPLWNFYFYDDEKECWYLRIVGDQEAGASSEFLYVSDKPAAQDLSELIHVQFGDLNNKAPFLFHSVRSLGFLLMEPIYHGNLLQVRLLQSCHEQLNTWYRVTDPAGKARALKIELYDKAIIPDGVTVVPPNERHQANPQLIEMGIGRMDKLKGEASVSYTQDTATKQGVDETATAVMARVSSVNAMMSGLLLTAFNYQVFEYTEICRRFCRKNSADADVRKFHKQCELRGIPTNFIDSELWEIEPEVPIGNGNPTMEEAQSSALMAIRPAFDPVAQQEILHERVISITGDPKKAERWAPIDKLRGVTDAQEHAMFSFAPLMEGVPVKQREGLNLQDQIETMLGNMAGVISRIEKIDNVGKPEDVYGLQNVAQYTNNLIQQLAGDVAQKSLVKDYSDTLSKLMNEVKAFAQRQQQAAQSSQQQNGDNGKGASAIIAAQTKAQIAEQNAQQKERHKESGFQQDERRKDAQTFSEIERQNLKAEQERANQPATGADA